ncbi:MAG: AmmeMemoRadiSam system protein A [Prolixibacteraceae bacterium]|jgi:AmmeMemoRadiSam system protein A|nr:AmmeMemoRadiSam system protein A [Prolixibacteraceae bacterium]
MSDYYLTDDEKRFLLKIARNKLNVLFDSESINLSDATLSENLKAPLGAFVSLYEDGQLRGCIGTFSAVKPLYITVGDVSVSSALNDNRFKPVVGSEIEDINIEISVLTPLEKIRSINEIELGKHGIYIKKGVFSGTFLPQVALKTNWTLEEFVGHCSRDKAGIGWDGWSNAELFRYRAIVFNETEFN